MTAGQAIVAVAVAAASEDAAAVARAAIASGAGTVVVRGAVRLPWPADLPTVVDATDAAVDDVVGAAPRIACLTLGDTDDAETGRYTHRTLAGLVDAAVELRSRGVELGAVVANSGSVWMLEHLRGLHLLSEPVFVEIPFGGAGALWAPLSFDALRFRLDLLPVGCVPFVSVAAGAEARAFLALALAAGANVIAEPDDATWAVELASTLGLQPGPMWDARGAGANR